MINITGIIIKNETNDYTLWLPEIPSNEPLLSKLMNKYANTGYSIRGTATDILQEVQETFD